MNKTIIVHHDDNDGYLAAEIAAGSVAGRKIEYFPVNYKDDSWFDNIVNSEKKKAGADQYYMLDFTAKPEQMDYFLTNHKGSFVHIDHHPRAEKYRHCVWDNRKSAALLTYEYFYPERSVPGIVSAINIYDLWKKGDPREWETALCVNMGYAQIREYFFSLKKYNYLQLFVEAEKIGRHIVEDRKKHFKNIKIAPPIGDVENCLLPCLLHVTAVITTPYLTSAFCEEDLKAQDYQIVILSDVRYDENRCCYLRKNSIRSLDDNVTVNEFAEEFGGGGHPKAAGFWTDINFCKIKM